MRSMPETRPEPPQDLTVLIHARFELPASQKLSGYDQCIQTRRTLDISALSVRISRAGRDPGLADWMALNTHTVVRFGLDANLDYRLERVSELHRTQIKPRMLEPPVWIGLFFEPRVCLYQPVNLEVLLWGKA